MRMLPIALCVTLLLLVSFAAQAPVVGEAAAQTQTKAQPESKEALYLKCRDTIFRPAVPRAAIHSGQLD